MRFWQSQIDKVDETTFRIGLLSGVSGSGKSSFVKAGLIPRLAAAVRPIFIEAATDETESRLLAAIHQRVPQTAQLELVETFAVLRRDTSCKTVVFIDQFEQWLQNEPIRGGALKTALRQCDGPHLQCVLLVRDEFGMQAAKILLDLDVSIDQGFNFAVVPMLPIGHAREILRRFGQALERLPSQIDDFSDEQVKFLETAIGGLAERGVVVPVHLALFTEIMRDRPWTESSLAKVGGAQGLGVVYLNKCFGEKSQHPACRLHSRRPTRASRPAPRCKSRDQGHHRTEEQLLEVSGYRKQIKQFEDLMRLLDRELRLITSARPNAEEAEEADDGQPVYLLAHDFMVEPLRDWLTREDKQTYRGRAELFAERGTMVEESGSARHLPSIGEWLGIHLFARGRTWSAAERQVMRRANWSHAIRYGLTAAMIGFVAFGLLRIRANQRTDFAVAAILNASNEELPSLLSPLKHPSPLVTEQLEALSSDSSLPARKRLNVCLALARCGKTLNSELVSTMLAADVDSFAHACRLLNSRRQELARYFEPYCSEANTNSETRLRAFCALAQFSPNSLDASNDRSDVVRHLLTKNLLEVPTWANLLRPLADQLTPSLRNHFENDEDPRTQQLATSILGTLHRDNVTRLLELADQSSGEQLAMLLPLLAEHRHVVKPRLLHQWRSLFRLPPTQRPNVPHATVTQLEVNGGLTSDYAFSTSLDATAVESCSNELEPSGYVETCRTSCGLADKPTMAVIWQKNGTPARQATMADAGVNLPPLHSARQRQLLLLFSGRTKTPFTDTFTITDVRYHTPVGRPDHATDVSWLSQTYWNVVPEPCMDVGNTSGRIGFPVVPFDELGEFTLEAWLYDWSGPVFGQVGTARRAGLWFCVGDGPGVEKTVGWLADDGTQACELSLGRSRLEGWNHVAFVFDGAGAYCYLNGKCVDSTQTSPRRPMRIPTKRRTPVFPAKLAYTNADGESHWGDGKLRVFRISHVARYRDATFEPPVDLECDDATDLFLNVTEQKVDVAPLPPAEDRIADLPLDGVLPRRARHLFLNGFTDSAHSEVSTQLHREGLRPVWFRKQFGNNRQSGPQFWQARWTRFTEPPPTRRSIDRLANLATMLWNLGAQQETIGALALRAENDLRSQMITHLAAANSDPEIVLNQLINSTDAGVRQALVLALSEFRFQVLSATTKTRAARELANRYLVDADPGVHSAIEYLYGRWGIPLPELTDVESIHANAAANWTRTFNDHLMAHVRIPVPPPNCGSGLDQGDRANAFSISTKPVLDEQFAKFVEDHDSVPFQLVGTGKPVTRAIWHEAAQYCNWLSAKSGLPNRNGALYQPRKTNSSFSLRRAICRERDSACRPSPSGNSHVEVACGRVFTAVTCCLRCHNTVGTSRIRICNYKHVALKSPIGADCSISTVMWPSGSRGDLSDWDPTGGIACGGDRNQPWKYQAIQATRQLGRLTRDDLVGFRIARSLMPNG
ncbi:MAG: LamG-like jellyroll fold domain-containing protein [Pirellulaceae bacterium]